MAYEILLLHILLLREISTSVFMKFLSSLVSVVMSPAAIFFSSLSIGFYELLLACFDLSFLLTANSLPTGCCFYWFEFVIWPLSV